ncbi:LysR family transcriptional regulator [Vibrio ezurae]|uniref:Putative LysR family transcriptional regulator n=1 Tax=Vibrio ezurae NBRC 102218 TaxID=1219080 RepID=U3CRP1_9VIBR|nr:LysR family transcriptional regulator [Vibrio ezurae]GAD80798.1 putative LysR family transcriptional regulator [Vibrio ezurae NBRC 102218]
MNPTLARVDLNLLVTMDVLLRERNVSRASQVLFVSQSAVSRALARLRDTFNDPLFTRVSTGLVPTEKALQIEKQLLVLLPQLQQVFGQEAFDPSTSDNRFAISMPAFLSSALFPKLILRLQKIAPRVTITEHSAKANPYPAIDQGHIDFALHFTQPPNEKYASKHLGLLRPQLFVRSSHPLSSAKDVALKDTLNFPMIGMVVDEDQQHSFNAPILQVYKQIMHDNHPILRSSQTQILIDVLMASDSILFGTNSIQALQGFGEHFVSLPSQELDQQHALSVPAYLVHHQRCSSSAAHLWMKEILIEELARLLPNS